MTARELFEFAQKYNLEDAQLEFNERGVYKVNRATARVDRGFPEQNKQEQSKIILSL